MPILLCICGPALSALRAIGEDPLSAVWRSVVPFALTAGCEATLCFSKPEMTHSIPRRQEQRFFDVKSFARRALKYSAFFFVFRVHACFCFPCSLH